VEDVQVLQAPSWWTLRRVLSIAAVVGVVALVAFIWVALLQKQVTERTRELEIQIQERQRAERQRLVEQERTRVARDLHDELGATLTEISMLGSLARTPALPLRDRERCLEKVTNVSRTMVATLDEIVWAVNPKYDSVASLASYYSLYAQRFLNLAGIACRLAVAQSFPSAPLDSRLRHGLFLAFKEALNNAVRHSNASQVRIEMEIVAKQLKIAVADNGRGVVLGDCPEGSDGLSGMRERMARLGGRCEIKSQPENGTTVEFWLPLVENAP
jgi:signal transduction histidine kinase